MLKNRWGNSQDSKLYDKRTIKYRFTYQDVAQITSVISENENLVPICKKNTNI